MNKKLGALALLGASAVVLAGCAAGEQGGNDASGTPAPAQVRVWLNGTDTPQDARDYLKKTFEAANPGSTLVIEEQQWTGLVDKLTTSLSSSDTPDVVEMGNTQSPAFTSSGALLDISDIKDKIGGDDLLPGFVAAGSWDGKLYAAPYYSGARIVFYNTAQYATAGVQVPTTLDEYVANGAKLAQALPGVSGVYFPGKDWYNALPFIWENGGEIAVQKDGKWEAQMSSDASVKGIEQVQQLMKSSLAPKDGDETEAWVPFRTEKAATLSAPSWAYWSIVADENKAETPLTKTVGYYALPGGGTAAVWLVPAEGVSTLVLRAEEVLVTARDANPGGALGQRMTFGFVLRDLVRRRIPVTVQLRAGRALSGTIDRAGADHLDIAVHEIGAVRRADQITGYRLIPFAAIAAVRLDAVADLV